WLSKRLGTEIKPPSLKPIGSELIGGRLLPGDSGQVAQFMYHDATGQRLTLYVTRETPKLANQPETAFRFGRDGPVNAGECLLLGRPTLRLPHRRQCRSRGTHARGT